MKKAQALPKSHHEAEAQSNSGMRGQVKNMANSRGMGIAGEPVKKKAKGAK